MFVRKYGTAGKYVILLHGGPGAAGYMKPVAEELASNYRVLEPFQRSADDEKLTVMHHIRDMKELIEDECGDEKPVLAGHSWGAMLALAYATEHSKTIESVILIGCGTFTKLSRMVFKDNLEERQTPEAVRELMNISEIADPDERFCKFGRFMDSLSSYNIESEPKPEECSSEAYEQTWNDMLKLQELGVYPAAFKDIDIPVRMIHGRYDIHPGDLIYKTLSTYITDIKYHPIENCGHYPWLEAEGRDIFYEKMREYIG